MKVRNECLLRILKRYKYYIFYNFQKVDIIVWKWNDEYLYSIMYLVLVWMSYSVSSAGVNKGGVTSVGVSVAGIGVASASVDKWG